MGRRSQGRLFKRDSTRAWGKLGEGEKAACDSRTEMFYGGQTQRGSVGWLRR